MFQKISKDKNMMENKWTLRIQNDQDIQVLEGVDPESTLEELFTRLNKDSKKNYLFMGERPLTQAKKSLQLNKVTENALLTIFLKPEKLSRDQLNQI